MALVEEPERQGVFIFSWSIKNFSRCTSQKNEYLDSPHFYFGRIKLGLRLCPKGDQSPNFVSLYLVRVGGATILPNTFKYVLSFQKCNGLFKESFEFVNGLSPAECKSFLSLDEFYKPDAYLNHDMLTIRCRIWKKDSQDADLSKSVHCFALTKIKIAKLNYLWMMEDLVDSDGKLKPKLRRSTGVLNFASEFPDIIIHLSTCETFEDDETIHFAIAKNDLTTLSVIYKINLLHSNGSIVHSISGEALFQKNHKFPVLSMRKLLLCKELYFSGGKLTVQFELSFSNMSLEIKEVEYGIANKLKSNSKKDHIASLSDASEVWKGNMQHFYSEGKYSDLIVRTPKKEFPVHRAILCAQSKVFDAMLTHEMKEKNTGVIDITDFDDETVSKMLMYLYTNTLDDIDYALAKDLYLAADKYQIKPLQIVCSKLLMGSIDPLQNVCDILLLADQLRDQELKVAARDFIDSNPHEIMNSDGWKSLKRTNVDLFAETTEWMILNKHPKY